MISELHAVVNNAGVMTIGEYEWQTSAMIESAINVNLLGTMRVTKAFLPDLRQSALEVSTLSFVSSPKKVKMDVWINGSFFILLHKYYEVNLDEV